MCLRKTPLKNNPAKSISAFRVVPFHTEFMETAGAR
jgi:hypothetical protein